MQRVVVGLLLVALALLPVAAYADEQRTAEALDKVRVNPLLLHDFLKRMPKGGDLHVHLNGAVFAESYLNAAAEDGLCIDVANKAFSKSQPVVAGIEPEPVCEVGDVPAVQALGRQPLYDSMIDSFSMRGFVPSEGKTAHDHFFDAYTRFGGTSPSHTGAWLDEVTNRAAAQNVQYLELMQTPTWNRLNTIAKDVAWREDLAALREEMLAKGLAEDLPAAREFWDQALAKREEIGRCGEAEAAPGCGVQTRFIYQVFRDMPKALVFAQALFGFELAAADPRAVAINFVGVEDNYVAMTDYDEHMRMVGFLRGLYPDVKVSLHAGELAPGLVPPEGLCCHIRGAVEAGKADRIGHGVDVMYEDRPFELLKEMAAKQVMVEIALSSNDEILGVRGKTHPFPIYREHGVPVALATDDPGISRITLTHEFARAVDEFGLAYADLKEIVRNSLEFSFLPGGSLFEDHDYGRVAGACSGDAGKAEPFEACAAYLKGSEKAAQQWELEQRFAAFEAAH
jgi:adenosine deaminase